MLLRIICLLCITTVALAFDYRDQPDTFWQYHLSVEVYGICRKSGTEYPFTGKYDNFYEQGTYYCACCGGDFPLFSSKTKFDSYTGWPSFYESLPHAVITRADPSDKLAKMFGVPRVEVVCARCESHLGHVFDDGPPPTGKRYCMNSLALTFTPAGMHPTRTYNVDSHSVK